MILIKKDDIRPVKTKCISDSPYSSIILNKYLLEGQKAVVARSSNYFIIFFLLIREGCLFVDKMCLRFPRKLNHHEIY